jgi:hypothetical protein
MGIDGRLSDDSVTRWFRRECGKSEVEELTNIPERARVSR